MDLPVTSASRVVSAVSAERSEVSDGTGGRAGLVKGRKRVSRYLKTGWVTLL